MSIVLPIVLAAIIAAAAAAVGINEMVQRARRPVSNRPHVDRGTQMWAEEVRRRLPDAFDALQVTKAGYLKEGKRPRPRFVGAGKPAPVGACAIEHRFPPWGAGGDRPESAVVTV